MLFHTSNLRPLRQSRDGEDKVFISSDSPGMQEEFSVGLPGLIGVIHLRHQASSIHTGSTTLTESSNKTRAACCASIQ